MAAVEPSSAEDLAAALKVVKATTRSRSGKPFGEPVTDEEVPGYSAVIKRPMDLGTIAQRLQDGYYKLTGECRGRTPISNNGSGLLTIDLSDTAIYVKTRMYG